MNFLKAISRLINYPTNNIDTLNLANANLNELYEESIKRALQVEVLAAPEVVLPAKVARHFQEVLDRDFMTIQFPDLMDNKSFEILKKKINTWNPISDDQEKNSVIKDSLNAVLTKKYIEHKQSDPTIYLFEEKKVWRNDFLKGLELYFNDPTRMTDAINVRESIKKNNLSYSKLTADELPRALIAINTGDSSTYAIKDMERLMSELSLTGFTTAEIKAMKQSNPAEILKLGSVIFSAKTGILIDAPKTKKPAFNAYMDLIDSDHEKLLDIVADQKLFQDNLNILAKPYIEYHHARTELQENIDRLNKFATRYGLLKQITPAIKSLNEATPTPVEKNISLEALYEQTNKLIKANNQLNMEIIKAMQRENEQLKIQIQNSTVVFPLQEFNKLIKQFQQNPNNATIKAWQDLLDLTQYQATHESLKQAINNLKHDNPHRVHSRNLLNLTKELDKDTPNGLASASNALQAVHAVIKNPSSEKIVALEKATAATNDSKLRDPMIRTQYVQARATLTSLLTKNGAQLTNNDLKLAGQKMLILTREVVGPEPTDYTALNIVVDALNSLNTAIKIINDPSDENNAALQNAQNLMLYYKARNELQHTISNMPKETPFYDKNQAELKAELKSIEEERQGTNSKLPPQRDLSKLSSDLKELNRISQLQSNYYLMREHLERTIKDLKELKQKSPFIASLIPYGQEILKLTKLRRISEFGDLETPDGMRLHDLTATLKIAEEAICVCSEQSEQLDIAHSDNLTKKAENCLDLGLKLAPPDKVKMSTGRKIAGILLGIAGVLMIAASVAVAVATYGLATPLSIAGVSLGISCITAGAAMGTVAAVSGIGIFKERKPHAMKIKESLGKIAKAASDKKVAAPADEAKTDKTTPNKNDKDDKGNKGGPVYNGL